MLRIPRRQAGLIRCRQKNQGHAASPPTLEKADRAPFVGLVGAESVKGEPPVKSARMGHPRVLFDFFVDP